MTGPTLVTLTGASDDTSIDRMIELSAEFPFIEWALLYSHSRTGQDPRYPTVKWIDTFLHDTSRLTDLKVNVAIHLCGASVNDFVLGKDEVNFINYYSILSDNLRIQLNFTLPNVKFTIPQLRAAIRREPFDIITQHHAANAIIAEEIFEQNHHFLFDSSGGRGIEATTWPQIIPERFCGYAGGLGPEMIHSQLDDIDDTAIGAYWIDMESKIRTNNLLDLDKCRFIATYVNGFRVHSLLNPEN